MFIPDLQNLKKILLALVVLFVLFQPLRAQQFRSLMADLRAKYEGTEKLHVVMEIRVFESRDAKTPYFSEHADIKREGINYRYQMRSNDLLMNSRYLIMVDKNAREISCSNRDLSSETDLPDPLKMNMDSIFNVIGEPRHIGSSEQGEHYSLALTSGVLEKIDLYVSEERSFIKKIEYQYREGQWATVEVSLFDIAPVFDERTFHETYYVLPEKGRFKTAPAFNGYVVLNSEGE